MNAQIARPGHIATCDNCGDVLVPSRATGQIWVHGHSGGSTMCRPAGGMYSFATDVRPV